MFIWNCIILLDVFDCFTINVCFRPLFLLNLCSPEMLFSHFSRKLKLSVSLALCLGLKKCSSHFELICFGLSSKKLLEIKKVKLDYLINFIPRKPGLTFRVEINLLDTVWIQFVKNKQEHSLEVKLLCKTSPFHTKFQSWTFALCLT